MVMVARAGLRRLIVRAKSAAGWKAMSIDVPTPYNALGGMTFRGGDDQNYYYLVFFLDHVGIARINNIVVDGEKFDLTPEQVIVRCAVQQPDERR